MTADPSIHEQQAEPAQSPIDEAGNFGVLTADELILQRRLVRKLDILIMPLVFVTYVMNFIDRNNYAAARLQGLEADLHLHGSQYETGLSILFVGYILGQIPTNLMMNHFGKPSLFIGSWVIAWGLVSLLTSQVKGFAGLVVCRLLLGTTESPFFAGVLFYLSKWYTKKELSLRMAIFYSGSMVSGAFGSLIAAGILNGLAGSRGLSAWQWLYIIEGTITISLGLTICFILPDFPHEWRRLSPDLRRLSIRRMKLDAAADDRDEPGGHSQMRGLRMALLDSKVYMLALAYHCINGASGFQNFFPTLTKTLGFSSTVSLLLVAPPYVFVLVYSYCHATLSDRMQTRFWFYMYTAPVASVGWIIFMTTTAFGPRYFSLFLMSFVFVQRSTIYAWVASSLPRPPAKRAAAYALINALGNSASIWTPYTYRKQDSPRYILALCICIALQSLYSGVGLWLRWKLRKQNAELDRLECLQPLELYTSHKNAGTVKQEEYGGSAAAVPGSEHRGFRYVV